jgi:hypothetical protein
LPNGDILLVSAVDGLEVVKESHKDFPVDGAEGGGGGGGVGVGGGVYVDGAGVIGFVAAFELSNRGFKPAEPAGVLCPKLLTLSP